MKIFNILFLAIKQKEFAFLVQRHNIDVQLYQEFDREWDIKHIKHHEPDYTPGPQGVDQVFFAGNHSFFHFPLPFGLYARRERPDIIIAHGFGFAFQQFVLNFFLPKKTKIIVQHHGESPFRNPVKRRLQRQAFARASAYLFSSRVMAEEFIRAHIITDPTQVYEMPESTTGFRAGDKSRARRRLQLPHEKLLFLWVGRLNANKDPLTLLEAFSRFTKINPEAQLFLFYHEDDMISEVRHFIREHQLSGFVHLMGLIDQDKLEDWYTACDYFVSASHYESTGYAFCEALACGCVPIATRIPSFQKLSNDGECAVLFEPGNANDLLEKLSTLHSLDYATLRQRGIAHFEKELSFQALSLKFAAIVRKVCQSGT